MLGVAGRKIIIPFFEEHQFIKPGDHQGWGTSKQIIEWGPMISKQNGCSSLEM